MSKTGWTRRTFKYTRAWYLLRRAIRNGLPAQKVEMARVRRLRAAA